MSKPEIIQFDQNDRYPDGEVILQTITAPATGEFVASMKAAAGQWGNISASIKRGSSVQFTTGCAVQNDPGRGINLPENGFTHHAKQGDVMTFTVTRHPNCAFGVGFNKY